jgi:ribosomal protein RSM22 (predicted rRNA methylase)
MADLPENLRTSLTAALDAVPPARLSTSVRRLIDEYRSGRPAAAPILTSETDVAAYAAYRMPATFAAVRAALRQLAGVVPEFRPRVHLDVGGGTGAAAWAAVEAFPDLATVTVLDQVAEALAWGRRLAARAGHPALRGSDWRQWRFERGAELPEADLVTISYLLGELPPEAREDLMEQAMASGGLVLVVEPGTPAGYERVLAARSSLLARGFAVLAPCPHGRTCPLADVDDWCHFAARVNRSALHRRLKEGQLGYEDEKFSYVAAVVSAGEPRLIGSRVLRHPKFRKGVVSLDLCRAGDGARRELVTKRQGEVYRLARDTEWGDAWPPPPHNGHPR